MGHFSGDFMNAILSSLTAVRLAKWTNISWARRHSFWGDSGCSGIPKGLCPLPLTILTLHSWFYLERFVGLLLIVHLLGIARMATRNKQPQLVAWSQTVLCNIVIIQSWVSPYCVYHGGQFDETSWPRISITCFNWNWLPVFRRRRRYIYKSWKFKISYWISKCWHFILKCSLFLCCKWENTASGIAL